MPPPKRSTPASPGVDAPTFTVWLLTLNCLMVCLLFTPEPSPPAQPVTPTVAAEPVVATAEPPNPPPQVRLSYTVYRRLASIAGRRAEFPLAVRGANSALISLEDRGLRGY